MQIKKSFNKESRVAILAICISFSVVSAVMFLFYSVLKNIDPYSFSEFNPNYFIRLLIILTIISIFQLLYVLELNKLFYKQIYSIKKEIIYTIIAIVIDLLFLTLFGFSKEIFLVNLSLMISIVINVLNLVESIKLKKYR
ncbi:MAG: hypothetical protein MR296_00350 [Tenericutes bacterium]|nr:hypothetical protein [Mycoplasmatota bacterium]